MTEVLESPELVDDSDPLMDLGHRSWDVPTPCRIHICGKPHMKLWAKDPAMCWKTWIWMITD